jgi:Ca2+-binding RTX toxin-like protein
MAISTNGLQLVRIAGAVFNQRLSSSDYSEILTANKTAAELNAWANEAVALEFRNKTTTDIAKAVLANVGLSDVAGLENWVAGQLNAGGGVAKAGATMLAMLNDFSNMTADATYGAAATTFNQKAANSQAQSQTAGTATGTYAAVSAVAPSATGATLTLTTGADSGSAFTGNSGDDTFNSVIGTDGLVTNGTTLNPGDNLTGGLGRDNLVINVSGTNSGDATQALSSVTLNGIEAISINNYEARATGTSSIDLSLATGLDTIALSGSSANGDTSITALRNLVAAKMQYGSGDLSITYADSALAGTTDVQALELTAVTGGTFTAQSTASGDVETIAVTSLGGTRNVLTGITNTTNLKSITVAGDTAVTLGTIGAAVTSLNASASKSGVTATLSTTSTVTVTGSSGNDSFTVTSALTTGTISGGEGTDALTLSDTVANGSTTNTADSIANTALLGARYAGFETLNISHTDAGNTTTVASFVDRAQDVSRIAGITSIGLTKYSLTATANDDTETATQVSYTNLSADVKNLNISGLVYADGADANDDDVTLTLSATLATNTTADALTVTLGSTGTTPAAAGNSLTGTGATDGLALTLALGNYETLNVVSQGAANAINSLTGTELKSLVATGSKSLTISAITGNTATTNIDASGLTTDAVFIMGTNASTSASTIKGAAGNDSLVGGSAADNIQGGDGADSITGAAGNDVVTGGAGNDTINAGAGVDNVSGEAGDDTFQVTTASNFTNLTTAEVVSGGDGNDILSFEETATAITIGATDLAGISSIENIVINGTSAAGAITLNDAVYTANGLTNIAIKDGLLDTNTGGTLSVDASALTAANSITVTANTLTGTNDTLTGGRGDDRFIFATTTGLEGNDVLNAGAGTDTISLTTSSGGVTAVMTNVTNIERIVTTGNGTGTTTITVLDANITNAVAATSTTAAVAMGSMTVDASSVTNGTGSLTYNGSNVTTVTGVGKIQNVTGTAAADSIVSGSGNDFINGGDGADTITGGAGIDSLTGGAGNDYFLVTAAAQFVGLDSPETVSGGADTDFLDFSVGANNIAISSTDLGAINSIGSIRIKNANSQTASIVLTDAVYTANGSTSLTVTNYGTGTDDGVSVTASGVSSANTLSFTGAATAGANESVLGGGGNDSFSIATSVTGLNALDASDTLNGGAGNDLLTISTGLAPLTAATLTNVANIERITVSGTTGGTNLVTLADANFATITAAAISATSLTTGALKITAAAEDDSTFSITGGSGADSIIGGQLADTINGGSGADTIEGGLKSDSLTGGSGADVFVFASAAASTGSDADSITDFLSGSDKINVTLGYSAFTVGLSVDATVKTARAGSSVVQDNLSGDRGQAAYDTVGNALYINVNNDNLLTTADYKINVNPGSTAATTIAEGDINFNITTGSGGDTITAGGGADTISSGDGTDNITAGAGADLILGGAGVDTLLGGTGSDVFEFGISDSAPIVVANNANDTGSDNINDFATGDLIKITITSADTVFDVGTHVLVGTANGTTTLGATGTYAATTYIVQAGNPATVDGNDGYEIAINVTTDGTTAAFAAAANARAATQIDVSGTGGVDTIVGGANADIIRGLAGADAQLEGVAGADTIIGGEGADVIVGGAGLDTIDLTETTAATDAVHLGRTVLGGTDMTLAAAEADTVINFLPGAVAGDQLVFDIGGIVVTNDTQKVATLSADGVTLTDLANTAVAGNVDILIVLGTYADYAAVQTVINLVAATITDATNGAVVVWQDSAGDARVFFDSNISAGAGTGTALATLVGVQTALLTADNFDVVA